MWRLAIVFAAACRGDGAPTGPTCAAMADHAAVLFGSAEPGHAQAIRDVLANRCVADRWSRAMRTCISTTTSLDAPNHCRTHLAAQASARLDADLIAIERGDACRRYESALAACTGLPADDRAALQAKLAEARRAQRDPERLAAMCERGRTALESVCGSEPGVP